MANKRTRKEMYELIKANFPMNSEFYKEINEFCDKQIESLDKKSETKKMTPIQIENEKRMSELLIQMEADKRYTITEMRETLPAFLGLSSQRATALIGILREAKKVEREVEKGVAYFKLAEGV